MGVSILYEVPRVCNSRPRESHTRSRTFQSSTRFLEFATLAWALKSPSYRWFQSSTRFLEFATGGDLDLSRGPVLFQSSTRFLEFATQLRAAPGARRVRFNPLRGSSSLQPTSARGNPSAAQRFNPLRGSSSLQLTMLLCTVAPLT